MYDPSESSALAPIPELLQKFCEQVVCACYDSQQDTQLSLQSWVHKLFEAGRARSTSEQLQARSWLSHPHFHSLRGCLGNAMSS